MKREQYEYSNIFWEDPEFELDEGLPKHYNVANNGDFEFIYLDKSEMKEFMKIKQREDPNILKDNRYKKLTRILKNN